MRARDNPFATERVLLLRYQFPPETRDGWSVLLRRLEGLRYRAALVGPHGSGKTTLLEDVGLRLRDTGFRTHAVFLNVHEREYPVEFARSCEALGERDIVLFDGCEQLGWLDWWRFRWQARRAGGLIITTHHAGRLPTAWRCSTDSVLLQELVERLTTAPRMTNAHAIRRLYESHHGNLRNALRELYDVAARSDALEMDQQANS